MAETADIAVKISKDIFKQRVAEGGHNVLAEKVTSRIPRMLNHIKQTLPLCDFVSILDNSRADNPFQQAATLRIGQLRCLQNPLPHWAISLLVGYLP